MIMMLLKDGPLTKARLKNELRTIQKKEFTPFQPHSDSAYNYWIKALKKRDILSEQNKILNLTKLGFWLVSSDIGSIEQRNSLLYLICETCKLTHSKLVLRMPIISTTQVNSKGDPFMDVTCPECGDLSKRVNMGSIAKETDFIRFYNQALVNLKTHLEITGKEIQYPAGK